MHFPAIPALILFSIASTVLTTPLHTLDAANVTTDVIALAEKRSEMATREAKGIVMRNEDITERDEIHCPACCCTGCCNDCWEEDVVERNETIVEKRNIILCPACLCNSCTNEC